MGFSIYVRYCPWILLGGILFNRWIIRQFDPSCCRIILILISLSCSYMYIYLETRLRVLYYYLNVAVQLLHEAQKLISLLFIVAEIQLLIPFARGIRVYSRAFVAINTIIVIPFYVKRSAMHSPNFLTAATISIEDEWLAGWQNYWSEVVSITATAILDRSVMTIASIW